MGRQERLRRFHAWHTGGTQGLRNLIDSERLASKCPQIADQIEVRLFEEFALAQEQGGMLLSSTTMNVAQRLGLHGVITRLKSVGADMTGLCGEKEAEANVEQVAWHLPRHRLQQLETSASKCLSLAERLHCDRRSQLVQDQTAFPSNAEAH